MNDTQPQDTQPDSRKRPKRRFVLSNTQILLIPILVFGGILVLDFRERVIEGQQKIAEQEALAGEIAELEAEQRRLQAAKAYYNSDAYVEEWAHSEGKMVRPGEVLIVPLPSEEAAPRTENTPSEPTVRVSSSPEQVPPWRIWWSLFFDSPPPFTTES